MSDLIKEADRLAASSKIPAQRGTDEARLFLSALWDRFPADAILGLTAETAYYSQHAKKLLKTETPFWIQRSALSAKLNYLLARLQAVNAEQTPLHTGGIFFRPAARLPSVRARFGASGRLDELTSVCAFWADIDCAAHNKTLTYAVTALEKAQYPPSAVWFTGGGLQAFWLLEQVWDVQGAEKARAFKQKQLKFLEENNLKQLSALDTSVYDATRMLRLPGFANKKPSRNNALSHLIVWQPALKLPLAFVESLEIPARRPPVSPPSSPRRQSTNKQIEGDRQDAPQASTLPRQPNALLYQAETPKDALADKQLFFVDRHFVRHLIEDEPAISRHPTLLRCAFTAAVAGIPKADFLRVVRPVARTWFSSTNDEDRSNEELDSLTEWAYNQAQSDAETSHLAGIAIYIAHDKFVLADPDLNLRTQPLLSRTAGNTRPPGLKLTDIRTALPTLLTSFLDDQEKRALLVKAPPGAGKTFTAWSAVLAYAKAQPNRKIAWFGQFKYDPAAWRRYRKENNIPAQTIYYWSERNPDQSSNGYCGYHKEAAEIAKRGYSVFSTLCLRCPLLDSCKKRGYLSQTEKAKKAQIVYARHQHLLSLDFLTNRDLIVVDEDCTALFEQPFTLIADQLPNANNALAYTQKKAQVTVFNKMLKALSQVVADIPAYAKYPTPELHTRTGVWLLAALENVLGADFERFFKIDPDSYPDFYSATLNDLSQESVERLPSLSILGFLTALHKEWREKFAQGVLRWNSTIVCYHNKLQYFAQQRIATTQRGKAIFLDATADTARYKQIHPLPEPAWTVYDPPVAQVARFLQITDSEYSRAALESARLRSVWERQQHEVMTADGELLTFDTLALSEPKGALKDIVSVLEMILREEQLDATNRLLIVSYKPYTHTIKTLITTTPSLKALKACVDIQHFGNLRGRNDYKQNACVLVIGAPRRPIHELLALAAARHYSDPTPLAFNKTLRLQPYVGTNYNYAYFGYTDERIDNLYRTLINSEIEQCAERVRANVPDPLTGRGKTIYLLANFATHYEVFSILQASQLIVDWVVFETLTKIQRAQEQWGKEDLITYIQSQLTNRHKTKPPRESVADALERIRQQIPIPPLRESAESLVVRARSLLSELPQPLSAAQAQHWLAHNHKISISLSSVKNVLREIKTDAHDKGEAYDHHSGN